MKRLISASYCSSTDSTEENGREVGALIQMVLSEWNVPVDGELATLAGVIVDQLTDTHN